jgi:hypothetical protein
MQILKDEKLFFGCKIDSKLREALANAKPGDRRYFEDPESEFLRVVEVDEAKWIGKVVKGGSGVNDVEDIQRNVISILRRIAPNIRLTSASVKIFAAKDGGGHATIEPASGGDSDDDDDGDGGGGGGGPYIDY